MNKQQLANRIWASANNMRNKIDANEYKDYILGLIFYKFLSDTEVKYFTETCEWEEDELPEIVENYEDENMKTAIEECQRHIGFFIEYKYLFSTWLNDNTFSVQTLSEALSNFERLMSNNYASVYEGIFKTLREGLSKLGDNPSAQTKALKWLIRLIKDIPTDGSQNYDVLGYVYEFLISKFAASAGKKAGEFYTPHEVAMIMSEIVAEHHKDKEQLEIYDPTSGSGSLLITIGKAVSKHIQDSNSVKYYAQELKESTYNLTRMNLVMRGIMPQNIITRCADTLEEDWPLQAKSDSDIPKPLSVDAVVSNPPYSQHWDPTNKDNDPRFKDYGVAPKTKADYAFLLHELHHLKKDGILTIVMPHGVLFRGKAPKKYDNEGHELPLNQCEEGQGEGIIRAKLIEKDNIDAIIGLPANLFYGTDIPTLIMVLRKNRTEKDGILIIDASKGFVKDGKQNRLRACDVKRIADVYRERKTIKGFSREVTRDEIRRNDYNLNIPRYVDSSQPPVKYDIYATMFGGIPLTEIADLDTYWQAFPTLKQELFSFDEARPYANIKAKNMVEAILSNKDVQAFKEKYAAAFADFDTLLSQRLIDNVEQVRETTENDIISADIFSRLQSFELVDKYAAYQILADHWQTIMGDIEIIQTEGFRACNVVEDQTKIVKDKNGIEQEVVDGQKGRIVPFSLVQSKLFADRLAAITQLQNRIEAIDGELEAARDELLAMDDTEKYFDAEKENAFIKKEITADSKPKADTEADVKAQLAAIVSLWNEQTAKRKQVKTDCQTLEKLTIEAIEGLDFKQIKMFLQAKWLAPITTAIAALPDNIVQHLADSLTALQQKYATTYNDIETSIAQTHNDLETLINQLTGDEYAIEGLANLIKNNKHNG